MHEARWRGVVAAMAAMTFVAAGCGGGDESGDAASTTSATSVALETTVAATTGAAPTTTATPTTTVAPTTTEAPTTTAAPTTTEAPLTAAGLDLAAAAIGPVAFGTGVEPALAVLTPLLGPPATDESHDYPYADEVTGDYLDDEDGVFAFPSLRRICFGNGLCTTFGGRSVDDLQLVGYDYFTAEEPVDPVLTTTLGLPLGARWSDFPDAMTAQAGGCYSQGFGDSDGVELVLVSSGEFFGTFDGETYTTAVPDPADVTVYGMRAGENPGYLYDDC